jgi:hypothetical protein
LQWLVAPDFTDFSGSQVTLNAFVLMISATFNDILFFATSGSLLGGNFLSGKGNLAWEVRLQRE